MNEKVLSFYSKFIGTVFSFNDAVDNLIVIDIFGFGVLSDVGISFYLLIGMRKNDSFLI